MHAEQVYARITTAHFKHPAVPQQAVWDTAWNMVQLYVKPV